jgi:hypothetical protein
VSRTIDGPRLRTVVSCTVADKHTLQETLNHLATARCNSCGAHAMISGRRVLIPHYVTCEFMRDFMTRHPKTEEW